MTIRRANPRIQGEIGLAAAIGWFAANGYRVAIPLADNQAWDLVVEDGGGSLQKVQVKTTTARSAGGVFIVSLRTNGGNQSFHTTKYFDRSASDLLFVLTDDGDVYLIPTAELAVRTSLSLCETYARYRQP
jgi:hypothetical protein